MVNAAVLRVLVICLSSRHRAHWVLAGPVDPQRNALVILAGPWRPAEKCGDTGIAVNLSLTQMGKQPALGGWQPPLYLPFSGAVSGRWSPWVSEWCYHWVWAMISGSGWGYLAVDFFRQHLDSWVLGLPGKAWIDMAVLSLWQRRGCSWNAEVIGHDAPARPHPQETQEDSGIGNSICHRALGPSDWRLAFRPER